MILDVLTVTLQEQNQITILLKIYQTIGDRYSEARALYRIGDSAASEKQWTEALRTYQQAANIWREMGLSDLVERILAPRIAQVEVGMKSTKER